MFTNRRAAWVGAIAAVVMAVIASITLFWPTDGDGGGDVINSGMNQGTICTGNADCSNTATTKPHGTRTIDANHPCPFPDATTPQPPAFTICVIRWCKGPVLDTSGVEATDQYQIKVRPLITNYSNEPLDISIDRPSRIRLLVAGAGIDRRWDPRPGTLDYGDRPVLVAHEGREYWAIAPNRTRTEVPAGGSGYYTGFATKWDGPTLLQPGSNYGQVPAQPPQGNLVFQVPLTPTGDGNTVAGVLGLAVLDMTDPSRPTVVAIDYADQWPEAEMPASF